MTKVTKQRFYVATDIMEMLTVKKWKAYEIMKTLNRELEEKGYFTQAGRVSAKYFEQRFFLEVSE